MSARPWPSIERSARPVRGTNVTGFVDAGLTGGSGAGRIPTKRIGLAGKGQADARLRERARHDRRTRRSSTSSVLSPNPHVRILAKMESQNPFGSVKDRIARSHDRDGGEGGAASTLARRSLEPSSGQHRHRPGRHRPPQGLPDQDPDARERQHRAPADARGLRRRDHPHAGCRRAPTAPCAGRRRWPSEHPEWAFLYQYGNDANPRAHYEGTGPEIWRDCEEVTHFVAGLGTSGTLMGTGTYLKERNPDIKVIAIEPPLGERVEGLRNLDEGYIPPVFDRWGGPGAARPQAGGAAPGVAGVDAAPARPTAASSPASRPAPRWPAR